MKVPFADFKKHYNQYKSEIDQAVSRVLTSGYFILGPELEEFEKKFAADTWTGFCYWLCFGHRSYLFSPSSLPSWARGEVIVVAHTAVPTISAISMTGATPVFVDIDPQTYVMDVNQIEKLNYTEN